MSEDELTTTRPGAVFAPYTGYEERIGGDYINYLFANTEDEVPRGARLSQIAISRGVSGAHAEAAIATATAPISKLFGPPSRCGIVKGPLSTGRVVVWDRGDEELMVSTWFEGDSTRFMYKLAIVKQPITITEVRSCG